MKTVLSVVVCLLIGFPHLASAKDQVLEWQDDVYFLGKENLSSSTKARKISEMYLASDDAVINRLGAFIHDLLEFSSRGNFRIRTLYHTGNHFVGTIEANNESLTFTLNFTCFPRKATVEPGYVHTRKVDYMTTTRDRRPSWFAMIHDGDRCVTLRIPVNGGTDKEILKKVVNPIFQKDKARLEGRRF